MAPIPHVDVKAQYEPLIPELKDAFARTLESGRFIFGPEVEGFEREAAAYLGVEEAIGVANGTDALVIVLDALGIGARRRGHLPGLHLLCHRRGNRPVGRDAGVRRHRPGDAEPRPERRRGADHAQDAGDHAGSPVRPAGADRRAPPPRPAVDRGLGSGLRRGRDRDERRLDLQLLPDEEPVRARGRRPDRRE